MSPCQKFVPHLNRDDKGLTAAGCMHVIRYRETEILPTSSAPYDGFERHPRPRKRGKTDEKQEKIRDFKIYDPISKASVSPSPLSFRPPNIPTFLLLRLFLKHTTIPSGDFFFVDFCFSETTVIRLTTACQRGL